MIDVPGDPARAAVSGPARGIVPVAAAKARRACEVRPFCIVPGRGMRRPSAGGTPRPPCHVRRSSRLRSSRPASFQAAGRGRGRFPAPGASSRSGSNASAPGARPPSRRREDHDRRSRWPAAAARPSSGAVGMTRPVRQYDQTAGKARHRGTDRPCRRRRPRSHGAAQPHRCARRHVAPVGGRPGTLLPRRGPAGRKTVNGVPRDAAAMAMDGGARGSVFDPAANAGRGSAPSATGTP
jgi:hypothetical protein